MRKISAMYQWSGGTDYCHTCYECRNCIKIKKGSRTVYKCLIYGNTDSTASDWKASEIACKAFNREPPEIPIIKTGIIREKISEPKEIEGQMSIEEYLKSLEGED